MRYVTRLILPTFCGLMVFLPIFFWPMGPIWTKDITRGSYLGFSPDEQHLYYLENISHRASHQKDTPITFVECDTRTGIETKRVTFNVESDFQVVNVMATRPFQKVLIYGSRARAPDSTVAKPIAGKPTEECVCYLYDMEDGKRVTGPWDCARDQDVRLSPDGRWIYVPGGNEANSERRIISSSTGEPVYQSSSEEYCGSSIFAEDSRSLATLALKGNRIHVVIVDIASGKEIHDYELPVLPQPFDRVSTPLRWQSIWGWNGSVLRICSLHTGANKQPLQVVHRFEVSGKGLKELEKESMRRITGSDGVPYSGVAAGKNAVSYVLPGLAAWPPWFTSCMRWADKSFRTTWVAAQEKKSVWAFHDLTTGRHRCSVSLEQMHSAGYSPTSKYLATFRMVNQSHGWGCSAQVWDIDPPPRWLTAGCAGLSAGVIVFLLRRWSRRRRRNVVTHKDISTLVEGS